MNPDERPFTSRQAAHALGVSITALHSWRKTGFATPLWRLPGGRGEYLWAPDEIRRLLALGNKRRRIYKARKVKPRRQPMDGLIIVKPMPRAGRGHGL